MLFVGDWIGDITQYLALGYRRSKLDFAEQDAAMLGPDPGRVVIHRLRIAPDKHAGNHAVLFHQTIEAVYARFDLVFLDAQGFPGLQCHGADSSLGGSSAQHAG